LVDNRYFFWNYRSQVPAIPPSPVSHVLSNDDELRRHLEEDKRISLLPPHEQDAARMAEQTQQQVWISAHVSHSSSSCSQSIATPIQQRPPSRTTNGASSNQRLGQAIRPTHSPIQPPGQADRTTEPTLFPQMQATSPSPSTILSGS
jgi:hypothetical protein